MKVVLTRSLDGCRKHSVPRLIIGVCRRGDSRTINIGAKPLPAILLSFLSFPHSYFPSSFPSPPFPSFKGLKPFTKNPAEGAQSAVSTSAGPDRARPPAKRF